MSFTPPKKEKLSGIFAVIMYLAAGLLLLFRPDIMNELTRWAVTAVLIYYAVRRAIAYFKTPAAEAAKGYGLTAAMMALTAALFTFITSDWMTYRLWGLLILFGGYMKFQTAWDFFRLGERDRLVRRRSADRGGPGYCGAGDRFQQRKAERGTEEAGTENA